MHIRNFTLLFSILTFTLAACRATPAATPTQPPPTPLPSPTEVPVLSPDFKFFGDDPAIPIIANGLSGDWDSRYINPGALLYHNGKFHMFRNGFVTWPGFVAVGYMTSEDGYKWNLVQDEPVFTSNELPFANPAMLVTSAFVMEDGTWVFIFSTFTNSRTQSVIGRATASSPLGPWTVDPEPILLPGGEGAWDENNVRWPNVVETKDGYVMFYSGQDSNNIFRIGRATSPDGVTWTKYDDPATTEDLYAESDPVLSSSGKWDVRNVDRPIVQLTPDGYVMIYAGSIIARRGLATSQDGILWEPYENNPIITNEDFPVPNNTWDTAMLYVDGTYFYYVEIGTLTATNIYLTTHTGLLFR